MKTKKCVSALLLSILMILSLVPTASATESGTATVITENEKAIITVDGTVIEIPVDDSTCEYIAETSVVNDAGVDWVRVDLYSVDEMEQELRLDLLRIVGLFQTEQVAWMDTIR